MKKFLQNFSILDYVVSVKLNIKKFTKIFLILPQMQIDLKFVVSFPVFSIYHFGQIDLILALYEEANF